MIPRLNWRSRFQWRCLLFPFSTGNALFGQIWAQNSKLFRVKFRPKTNSNWNMQNSMVVFTFSVFERKYPFWANLFQKITIVSLSWNLVLGLIRLCRIEWCSLFPFSIGNTLFEQILSVSAEIWYLDYLNIYNSMMVFTFSVFNRKYTFKNPNCQIKLKFGAQDEIECAEFNGGVHFFFDWKYPFWTNLVQNFKIDSVSWNFVPGLILICRIHWWFLFFSRLNWRYPFWANLVKKLEIVSLNWNFVSRLIQTCSSVMVFTFSILDQNYLFCASLVQKDKIVILNWN